MNPLTKNDALSYRIILASKSPRRKELLAKTGLPFEICPSVGEEIKRGQNCRQIVMNLAHDKAKEVYDLTADNGHSLCNTPLLVIGADTIVVYKDEILGKPKDKDDARRMISMLSGNSHDVYTGVCLYYSDGKTNENVKVHTFFEGTKVEFYSLSEEEIEAYISCPDPYDKAGSYGIQGDFAIYVKGIRGDYNNVVGLPLARLYHEMKKLGIIF